MSRTLFRLFRAPDPIHTACGHWAADVNIRAQFGYEEDLSRRHGAIYRTVGAMWVPGMAMRAELKCVASAADVEGSFRGSRLAPTPTTLLQFSVGARLAFHEIGAWLTELRMRGGAGQARSGCDLQTQSSNCFCTNAR